MRAVIFTGAGGNEVVAVEHRPDPRPGTGEVVVGVRYAGLNPADLQQRNGRYPAPRGTPADMPGLEVAGEVVAVGGTEGLWRVGDRVMGLVSGAALAERVLVHERCLTRTPDVLDEPHAAAVPEAFITAHDALRTQGELAMGETVLVHGATGGVGTAAIQLARAAGAQVLAVSRSAAGRRLVAELGADAVDEDGYAAAVLEATGGRGADLVLELVGAPHFPDNLTALAEGGRIVVVGVAGGARADVRLLPLMQKRATIRGTVMRSRPLEDKARAVRAFEHEVIPHLRTRRIRPLVDRTFDVDDIAAAFDHLETPGRRGKVLLRF